MASVPDKMRALVLDKPTHSVEDLHVVDDKTVPKLGSDIALPSELKQVLVKVECAGLNPVDAMVMQMGFGVENWPFVLGSDFSGTIAEVSEGSKWKVGQKVWGFSGVAKPAGGTLAEYCATPEWMVAPVPDNVDMQGASTLGTAGLAAAAALWQYLGLERIYDTRHETTPILVYGASSCLGCFAVQLLKLAGYRIIAVASKKNHEYLTKLGATQLFDYHDSDYKDQIAKDPQNQGLKAAVDAIGMDTAGECFDTFAKCGTAPEQGLVATVRLKEMQKEELKNKPDSELIMVSELLQGIYDPSRDFLPDYVETFGKFLSEGKLIPSNVTVCNGLEGAKEGMQKLADYKTQLEKMVVCV